MEILPGPLIYVSGKDVALGIISGIFIGFSIVIMSFVTKTVHPFLYATISTLFAIPFLFIISFFFSGYGLKGIVSDNKSDFVMVFLERAIIGGLLLTFGVSMTLAIKSVFLVQLEPAFVFAWSVLLLKESIRKSKLFLIGSLIFGAFLLTTGGAAKIFESVLFGDLLILAALIFLSHSYILSARMMKTANPMKLNLGFSLLGLPVFVVLSLLFLPVTAFNIGIYYIFLILVASLLFNVTGLPLWLFSLKKLKPWVLASALVVQTIAGAILSFLWLGQTLSLVQMVGGGVILISVYLISLRG